MTTTYQKQRKAKLGSRNPRWKGGKAKASNGYTTVPAPWKGSGGQREYEHVVKAKPKRGQLIHHKNRNRADNRPSNLLATKRHRGVKKGLAKRIAEELPE